MTDNLIFKTYPRKVALVHDWFSSKFSGGAEKALEIINKVLVENYSTPDLYSLIADIKTKVKMHLRNIQILFWTTR